MSKVVHIVSPDDTPNNSLKKEDLVNYNTNENLKELLAELRSENKSLQDKISRFCENSVEVDEDMIKKYYHCLALYVKYMNVQRDSKTMTVFNTEKSDSKKELLEYFKNFGDIYNKLSIDLYMDSAQKKYLYPDNNRVQDNLKVYLNNLNKTIETFAETQVLARKLTEIHNIVLYNILLNDNLRELYNEHHNNTYKQRSSGGLKKHNKKYKSKTRKTRKSIIKRRRTLKRRAK